MQMGVRCVIFQPSSMYANHQQLILEIRDQVAMGLCPLRVALYRVSWLSTLVVKRKES
jgi:hypothetical protein